MALMNCLRPKRLVLVPEYQRVKPKAKLPVLDFEEIISILCHILMILTHLVGIEITRDNDFLCQAEMLKGRQSPGSCGPDS